MMPTSPPPDPIYQPENIALFETLYGKNLISLGGHDAIQHMFSDVEIRNLKALDIGFGLGGVAFFLAQTYQLRVAGIEIHPWMIDYASRHAPDEIKHLLKFVVYDEAGNIPFDTASFDLAYSKGVLNHVHDKKHLFIEINRVLKPDGLFVIADWIYPHSIATDDSNPLVAETKESYDQILTETGFCDLSFRDDSKRFSNYVNELLGRVTRHRTFIEEKFGSDIFNTIWQDHQKLLADIHHKKRCATRIKAKKK